MPAHIIEQPDPLDPTKRCTVCGKTFPRGVWGECAGVKQYEWGQASGLYTARQLNAMGLIPGPIVGALYYSKAPEGWLWLYRKEDAAPKPALSEKQQATVKKMQQASIAVRTCQRCGVTFGHKRALLDGKCSKCLVAQWCQEALDEKCLILDVETTGLDDDAEIVSLSIIDYAGDVRLSTYVKPLKPINERGRAYEVNGISNAMVKDAPHFADIYPFIGMITRNRTIIAYNSAFDEGMVNTHLKRYSLPALHNVEWYCLMTWFAEGFGIYNFRRRRNDWVSLGDACRYMGVPHESAHDARGDCYATLELLKAVAAWKPKEKVMEGP